MLYISICPSCDGYLLIPKDPSSFGGIEPKMDRFTSGGALLKPTFWMLPSATVVSTVRQLRYRLVQSPRSSSFKKPLEFGDVPWFAVYQKKHRVEFNSGWDGLEETKKIQSQEASIVVPEGSHRSLPAATGSKAQKLRRILPETRAGCPREMRWFVWNGVVSGEFVDVLPEKENTYNTYVCVYDCIYIYRSYSCK